MSKTKRNLIFLSRHKPNDGQIALAKKMEYTGIKQIPVVFSEDPIKDLQKAGIKEKTLAIVAPSYITNVLLNAEYKLIEFVNSPLKREKMVFVCKGAYKYYLQTEEEYYDTPQWGDPRYMRIKQEYISCPIPIDEQYESSLTKTET